MAELQTKHFLFANPAVCRMLGCKEKEVLQLSVEDIHPKASLEHVLGEFEALARGENTRAIHIPCQCRDGSVFYADISNTSLVLDGAKCNVGFFTDVTKRKQMEESIRQSEGRYRTIIEEMANSYYEVDLDGFKEINDTMGHEAGDRLLKVIATRLKNNLRTADVAARMGGDEFILLMEEVTDSGSVATVACKMKDSIAQPLTMKGRERRITASIGISLYPNDADDGQTLITHADKTMYAAKAKGKNNYQFYADNQ